MENLIVYQKMLELTEYAYIALRQFPKSEKFGLAADNLLYYKFLGVLFLVDRMRFT